ncbi:MAG: phosphoribosyltransferase [Planctomycetota bacterium]|jgi:putative phosphoribosyl transferase
MLFRDRHDAGRRLVPRLQHLKAERPVVLGLPRGGLVVAAEIATALEAPLEVLVVRKIPAPSQPELALGAVTDGEHPERVINEAIVAALSVPEQDLDEAVARQLLEVRRRQKLYRQGREVVQIGDRIVVLVDDGIATGATVQVALEALRRRRPSRLVLAVPVASPQAVSKLQPRVDELVCLATPAAFTAVGAFYERFEQTTDAEVISILEKARA